MYRNFENNEPRVLYNSENILEGVDFNKFYGVTDYSQLETMKILQTHNSTMAERIEKLEKENAQLKKKTKKQKLKRKAKRRQSKSIKGSNKSQKQEKQEDVLAQFINRSNDNLNKLDTGTLELETLPKSDLIGLIKSQNFWKGDQQLGPNTAYTFEQTNHHDATNSGTDSRNCGNESHFISSILPQGSDDPYFVNSSFSKGIENVANKKWVNGLRSSKTTKSRQRPKSRSKSAKTKARRFNRSYLDYSTNFDNLNETQ